MTRAIAGKAANFIPHLRWIVGLALAFSLLGIADAHAQLRREFDPSQFDCSSGPGMTAWPLHMVTYIAQEAHYCVWDLDKLFFSSVGQPIQVMQRIDTYVIYQDVTWNPLTQCRWKCHAPFAAVADPKHPAKPGQAIAEGTYRIVRMTQFAEKDGGAAIEIPVVELMPPDQKRSGLME